jgi:hypothetical protein
LRSSASVVRDQGHPPHPSTLRSHIEAMGGQLEVIAHFPDGAIRINNFSELDEDA